MKAHRIVCPLHCLSAPLRSPCLPIRFNVLRTLHTARPLASGSPLFQLSGLSNARETRHLAKNSGLSRVEHSPNLQLIRSSEKLDGTRYRSVETNSKTRDKRPVTPDEGTEIRIAQSRDPNAKDTASQKPTHQSTCSPPANNGSESEPSIEELIRRLQKQQDAQGEEIGQLALQFKSTAGKSQISGAHAILTAFAAIGIMAVIAIVVSDAWPEAVETPRLANTLTKVRLDQLGNAGEADADILGMTGTHWSALMNGMDLTKESPWVTILHNLRRDTPEVLQQIPEFELLCEAIESLCQKDPWELEKLDIQNVRRRAWNFYCAWSHLPIPKDDVVPPSGSGPWKKTKSNFHDQEKRRANQASLQQQDGRFCTRDGITHALDRYERALEKSVLSYPKDQTLEDKREVIEARKRLDELERFRLSSASTSISKQIKEKAISQWEKGPLSPDAWKTWVDEHESRERKRKDEAKEKKGKETRFVTVELGLRDGAKEIILMEPATGSNPSPQPKTRTTQNTQNTQKSSRTSSQSNWTSWLWSSN